MTDKIREVLAEHGRLSVDVSEVRDGDDLYGLGLTSHASVSVMLALEDTFSVEFPEYMLRKSTFESVAAIREALDELSASPSASPPGS
jgi:acyl carrier protein